MNNYVIYTDSSCDLSNEAIANREIYCSSLTFKFSDSKKEYSNDGMSIAEFYNKMRKGAVAKTSAVNSETFSRSFDKILIEGNDILYIGFSSGLSTTLNSARLAAQHLTERYPKRKIVVVDSLSASAGTALLIDLVIGKKKLGASIDEAAKYAEQMKLKICHWFTVDDLVYLKRGGRISSTTAFVGNMFGIKPILHVDNNGHLVNAGKVRGRKLSIETLAKKYGELRDDEKIRKVFISHGDCIADAEELASVIENNYGVKSELITYVGPVIGAHSGPGTLALFFVGKER